MPRPKTNAQVGRMFGLARKADHGFESDHDYLASLALEATENRTASLANLTFAEANAIIERLGGDAFTARGLSRRTINYHKQKAGIKTIETEAHLHKIAELAEMRNMSDDGLQRLAARMNVPYPPQTTEQGNKIVEALKAMNKRDGLLSFRNPKSKIPNPKSNSVQPGFRRVA